MTDTEPQTRNYKKIKEFYFSDNPEDKTLAEDWLIHLLGENDAAANMFVLEIYRDMETDENIIIDEETYCKMKFDTFPIYFGKNYMYRVSFDIKFQGQIISDSWCEYSRWQVGNSEPKYDALEKVCKWLRGNGFNLVNDLYK